MTGHRCRTTPTRSNRLTGRHSRTENKRGTLITTWYNVLVETNDNTVTDDEFDALESRLSNLSPSIGMNPYGNLSVRGSLDAENLQQASVLASNATDEAMRHVGVNGSIVGISTLTEDEFVRREDS